MREKQIDRREFMRRAAFAAGSVAAGLWLPGRIAADVAGGAASARVTLGTTGVEVSRLGMGTGMRGGGHQSNQTRLGMKAFSELAQHSCERGITCFDASDNYGSHPFLRDALKELPRDTLTLSTKVEPNSPDGAAADVERFLKELGTDYIDVVLLHCMRRSDWNTRLAHMMDDLSEAKQRKLVRAVGVSCHSVAALRTAAALPWVDVVLARINHDGTKMDATPEVVVPVLREIHDAGKGVIGMKIAGEGKLVDQLDKSLEFVMHLGCVDAMIIGFEKIAEVEDTISRMERVVKREAAVLAASAA